MENAELKIHRFICESMELGKKLSSKSSEKLDGVRW